MSNASSSSTTISPAHLLARLFAAVGVIIGVVGLFLVGQFIGVIVYYMANVTLGQSPEAIERALSESLSAQFIATLFIEIATLGLLWLALRYFKRSFVEFFKLKVRPKIADVWAAVAAYPLYFVLFLVVASLAATALPGLDVNQEQQLGISDPIGGELVLVFCMLVILPSILEEILFRGVLFRGLKKYTTLPLAVVVSSIIFGAAHLEFFSDAPLNYIAALDTTIFGIVLAFLYYRRGTLWAPMLLHAIKNSIAFVFLFIL